MTSPSPFAPVLSTQRAGGNEPYEIDVSSLSVGAWQANASMPANGLVRPTLPNQTGFIYQNGAGGQTGALEPAWPRIDGGTVTDGSIDWTALVPPASGSDAISSVSWTQESPPDGALTITSQQFSTTTASAYIGGGTSGQVYTVLVSITMQSTAVWPVLIYLTIL